MTDKMNPTEATDHELEMRAEMTQKGGLYTSIPDLPHSDMEPLGGAADYRHIPLPYTNQRWGTPNWFNGSYACGPTSCITALAGSVLQPWPLVCSGQVSEYGQYVATRYQFGESDFFWTEPDKWGNQAAGAYGYMMKHGMTYWEYVTKFLRRHGREPEILYPVCKKMADPWLREQIDAGRVVVTSGMVKGYGHFIVICGYDHDLWIVNDPWGDATKPNWGGSSNGGAARYSWDLIQPRCCWSVAR